MTRAEKPKIGIPSMPELWKHAMKYYRYQGYVLSAFIVLGGTVFVGSQLSNKREDASVKHIK